MGKTIDMMGAIELDAFGAEIGVARLHPGAQFETDSDYRERIRAALVEKEQAEYFSVIKSSQSAMVNLTLRDYFAAKAMASLTSVYWEDFEQYGSGAALIKCQIETAYEMADAMIAERAR